MSVLNAVLETLNSLKLYGSSTLSNQQEVDNMETAEKLRIFSSLPTIAASLGPVDTREKLLPTLDDLVTNAVNAGDDEVLLAIAQKLNGFSDLVGGREHAKCIVNILQQIIYNVEEIVVAEAACDTLVALLPTLPQETIEDKVIGMIRRILEEDLYCSSRKVSTKLITACYPLVSAKFQPDLKYRIFHLADSDDEVPLVRAAAVQQLVDLAKLIGPELKTELCLLLTSLVSDNQRVVRAACVGPVVELSRMVTDPNEFDSSVRPCIDKLATDTTRDTRRALANAMTDLQRCACAFGTSSRSLHPIMLGLLEDNEVETRRIAATQLKGFCLASPKEILSNVLLLQLREHLAMEREEPVRAQLVRCAVELLPSIGREDSLPLVQHILAFLNDTSSQSKQYVFEHFADLVILVPASDIQLTLLPSLLRLWQDKNWRVRLGVVQSVPCLYTMVSEQDARDTVLPANLAWLRDPSWHVRECACRGLARLLRAFPQLSKDALNGFGSKLPASTNAAAAAATNTTTASSPPSTTTSNANSSAGATPNNVQINPSTQVTSPQSTGNSDATVTNSLPNPSSNSPGSNAGQQSINAIMTQAAAGGLKALASDPNYHLRQIYISAVQTLLGPGIPDESPYSASEDSPEMGICLPGIQSALSLVRSKQPSAPSTAAVPPPFCQQPPKLAPAHVTACVSQLLRMLAEDTVANVRICAAQALQLVSGALDKKFVQKEVIPVLRKVSEADTDYDVRYYAQDSLSVFAS